MRKRPYKQRERARREAHILRTAGHIIREQGYNELTMEQLAEAVGISKPTLYQHFSTKDDMVAQVALCGAQNLTSYLENLEAGSPLTQLEKIMRYVLESQHAPDGFSMPLVYHQVMDVLKNQPDLIDLQDAIRGYLLHTINTGQQAGEIDPQLAPEVIMGSMFALLAVLEPPREFGPLTPDDIQKRIEHLVRFFIRGIRAPQANSAQPPSA